MPTENSKVGCRPQRGFCQRLIMCVLPKTEEASTGQHGGDRFWRSPRREARCTAVETNSDTLNWPVVLGHGSYWQASTANAMLSVLRPKSGSKSECLFLRDMMEQLFPKITLWELKRSGHYVEARDALADTGVVPLRANTRVDVEGRVTGATRSPPSRRPRTQCRLGKRRGSCGALLKMPIGLRHTFAQRHAIAVGTVSRLSSGTETKPNMT
jgi:hypothetical protein